MSVSKVERQKTVSDDFDLSIKRALRTKGASSLPAPPKEPPKDSIETFTLPQTDLTWDDILADQQPFSVAINTTYSSIKTKNAAELLAETWDQKIARTTTFRLTETVSRLNPKVKDFYGGTSQRLLRLSGGEPADLAQKIYCQTEYLIRRTEMLTALLAKVGRQQKLQNIPFFKIGRKTYFSLSQEELPGFALAVVLNTFAINEQGSS